MRFLFLGSLALVACTPTPGESYDKLCKIYGEYKPDLDVHSGGMQAMKIYERVERELPQIMTVYGTLVLNGVDVRYRLMEEQIRKETNNPNWECDAMRKHWTMPVDHQ
jgi:hypothetical protein